MKKPVKGIVLISVLFFSCKSILLSLSTKKTIDKDVKVLFNKETNQSIVFLPMVHVGPESYYKSCKVIIDSLRKESYKFYYENVVLPDSLATEVKDIYQRKFRKLLGFNAAFSEDNKSLPKELRNGKYVLQNYKSMGLIKYDIKLDLSENQIVDLFESEFGEIALTDCDLITDLESEYKCDNDYDKYKFNATNVYRDEFLVKEILKLEEEKIVLIYGKMHWFFIYPDLIKNGYELIQGKI